MKYSAVAAWKLAPFIRLLVPFILGIVVYRYFPYPVHLFIGILIIAISMLAALPFFSNHTLFQHYWITGLGLNLLLFCAGAFNLWWQQPQHQKNCLCNDYAPNAIVAVTLTEPLIEKENAWKAVASVNAIKKDHWQKVTGNIIVYFKKEERVQQLQYGTSLLFNHPLQPITNTGNPGAFDYRQYCYDHAIFYQVFLSEQTYSIVSHNNGYGFIQYIYSIQDWVVKVLHKYIKGEKERGLALALLIGYKNELDPTLVQSYTNTGVVHIIAISGMHLGIIYWLLSMAAKPLLRWRYGKWLKPVIIIVVLWLFSLLAGATPSVVRSALMFTCFAIGEVMGKKSLLLNSLGASAFLLLGYHPFWLWDVGFQLSYAAVLSILLFMKPLYRLIIIDNLMLEAVWKLASVTIAVQVLTFPLSLYYFHQFPVYFLFTNILAIPLSSIILLATIALCICSGVAPVAIYIGQFIQLAVNCMNTIVAQSEKLPFAMINHIPFSLIQFGLMYMVIAGIALYISNNQKKYFFLSMIGSCGILWLHILFKWNTLYQHKLVVFNISRSSAIAVVHGTNTLYIADSILWKNEKQLNYILKPAQNYFHSSTQQFYTLHNRGIVQLQLQNNQIFVANAIGILPKQCHQKIVVLSHYKKLQPEQLFAECKPELVVADGSISRYQELLLKDYCLKNSIPFHAVVSEGAYMHLLK